MVVSIFIRYESILYLIHLTYIEYRKILGRFKNARLALMTSSEKMAENSAACSFIAAASLIYFAILTVIVITGYHAPGEMVNLF